MPQQVQVDGVGMVEFSDDFTPDEILRQVDSIYARQEMEQLKKKTTSEGAIDTAINITEGIANPVGTAAQLPGFVMKSMGVQGVGEPLLKLDAQTLRKAINESPFWSGTLVGALSDTIFPELAQSASSLTTPESVGTLPFFAGGGPLAKTAISVISANAAGSLPSEIQRIAESEGEEKKQAIADTIFQGAIAAAPFVPAAASVASKAAKGVRDIPAAVDLLREEPVNVARVDAAVRAGMEPIPRDLAALAPETAKASAEPSVIEPTISPPAPGPEVTKLSEEPSPIAPDAAGGPTLTQGEPNAQVGIAPVETPKQRIVTEANRSGSTINISFDITGEVPTAKELTEFFKKSGYDVDFKQYAPDIVSTSSGVVRFEGQAYRPDGPYSEAVAKSAFLDVFGQDNRFSTQSMAEKAMPLSERFSKTLDFYAKGGESAPMQKTQQPSKEIPNARQIESPASMAGNEPSGPVAQVAEGKPGGLEEAPTARQAEEGEVAPEPSRIKSYGERYVEEHGVEGARKRIEHLNNETELEIKSGLPDRGRIKRLQQEAQNIANGIDKKEVIPSAKVQEKGQEVVPATIGQAPSLPPVASSTGGLTPPKGIDQIIRDLSSGLQVPIRFGRLRIPKVGGYFDTWANLIASKRPNAMQAVTHEVGHKMDQLFDISGDKAFEQELMVLGDNARPGSASSWKPGKTVKYRLSEGVGEFVRYWMTNPTEAARLAPGLASRFDQIISASKDVENTLRQAKSDIEVWRNANPQARLRSHIITGNPNQTRYSFNELMSDVVDDLNYTRLARDAAVEKGGAELRPSEDPYTLNRLLRGNDDMVTTFTTDGVVDFNTLTVKHGTSLRHALGPIASRLDDFRDYIVAKQAKEMQGQGKPTGLVPGDVDYVLDKFKNDVEFQKSFALVNEWTKGLRKYAVDSGYLSQESATAMENMVKEWVPMNRLFEVGAGEMGQSTSQIGGQGVAKVGNAFRSRHGSERPILDPLESYMKNAFSVIVNANKNNAVLQLVDLQKKPGMGKYVERVASPKQQMKVGLEKIRKELEASGADLTNVPDDLLLTFWKDSKHAPTGENIISVKRGGELEFYRLDPDLYRTVNSLDHESVGTLSKMMAAPAQWLRTGVTSPIDFAVSNASRDTVAAGIISRYGTLPVYSTLNGLRMLLTGAKEVKEFKAAGGSQSLEVNYFDREAINDFLKKRMLHQYTLKDFPLLAAKSPLILMRAISAISDQSTRVGTYVDVYKKLRKQGFSERDAKLQAAYEARDLQDFAKGGAKTKTIRRSVPFWNAMLQGNIRLAQNLNPKNPVLAAKTIIRGMAYITIPTLTAYLMNRKDPDYWDRPQWERDMYWLIPRGKDELGHTKFIKIPKPFLLGLVFGTMPERAMAKWDKEDPQAFDSLAQRFSNEIIPVPISPVYQTIGAVMAGKQGYDWFRGRPIVPESLADAPADMQATQQTSLTARKVGKLLGVSPMKVDYAIRNTTGTLGRQLTHEVLDRAIEAMTDDKRTARTVHPGSRFITTPAGIQSEAVDRFYNKLDLARQEESRKKASGQNYSKERDQRLLLERASERMAQVRKKIPLAKTDTERQQLSLEIRSIAESAISGPKK